VVIVKSDCFLLHAGEDLKPLNWDLRVYIALDVARGLEYLHNGVNFLFMRTILCACMSFMVIKLLHYFIHEKFTIFYILCCRQFLL
jgi:hypothetical protein